MVQTKNDIEKYKWKLKSGKEKNEGSKFNLSLPF